MADDFYIDMRDENLYEELYTTQAMSTYDITRRTQFSQVMIKRPPAFDGKTSWLAYEDATGLDGWCDITKLDRKKRRPALKTRLGSKATIYKKVLDTNQLKSEEDVVAYFTRALRPFFVKGSANVVLYRFQLLMNLQRGSFDLTKWMSRFQIQLKRLEETWRDTLTPLSDPAHNEVRLYTQSVSADEQ